MKKILYYCKVLLVPIFFELTVILSETVGEPINAAFIFYLIFAVLSTYCYTYKEAYMQFMGGLLTAYIEVILIDKEKNIFHYLNEIFNLSLSIRGTTANSLICIFIQVIAFIAALIIAFRKRIMEDGLNGKNDVYN